MAKNYEVRLLAPAVDPNRHVQRIWRGTDTMHEVPSVIDAEIVTAQYTVTIRLSVEQPDPMILDMHVTGRVPTDVLRSFKLGAAVREIVEAATTTWRQVEGEPEGVYEVVRQGGVPDVAVQMLRRGRRPDKERIETEAHEVAREYNRAVARNDKHPIATVEVALGMSRRTVQRRKDLAESLGLIEGN